MSPFFLADLPGIPFLRQVYGDQRTEHAADGTGDRAADHVGGEVDAEIDAGNAHQDAEHERRPAPALVAEDDQRDHGGKSGVGMARGEALIALRVLPDHGPELIKDGTLIHIGPGPRDHRQHMESGPQGRKAGAGLPDHRQREDHLTAPKDGL